jgi:hypothetical protein
MVCRWCTNGPKSLMHPVNLEFTLGHNTQRTRLERARIIQVHNADNICLLCFERTSLQYGLIFHDLNNRLIRGGLRPPTREPGDRNLPLVRLFMHYVYHHVIRV